MESVSQSVSFITLMILPHISLLKLKTVGRIDMQPRHLGYVCAWGRPGGRLLSSPYGNGLLTDRRVAESEASATVERGSLPVAHETNQTRYSNNVIQRLIITNLHGGLGVTRSAPVSKGRSSWPVVCLVSRMSRVQISASTPAFST